ncbi:unnamed protein product [Protopolystoma xenopodis]|uniref:Uncharacterized protein n=1 Tax=Protopolystoma xenopodis TaxID=117903 RepID=A0A3S5FDY2_9PLAT|nr:unnamed protein product [Protopolystoma xenopodis]
MKEIDEVASPNFQWAIIVKLNKSSVTNDLKINDEVNTEGGSSPLIGGMCIGRAAYSKALITAPLMEVLQLLHNTEVGSGYCMK